MKLILFDIDGTLMSSGGAGTKSLDLSFEDVFSIKNAFSGISMAGKTDLGIIKEGLVKHGISPENGAIPGIVESYLKHLGREIRTDMKHLKPGIREALDSLAQRPGLYSVGLLTGNLEEGARIKLGSFGLNHYFTCGAFGSDDEDRNRLLPIAVQRFIALSKRELTFRDCVIIGDTPRDVYCSKPYGAACIGVATGPYPLSALVEAGADFTFDDLSDTERFMKALDAAGDRDLGDDLNTVFAEHKKSR